MLPVNSVFRRPRQSPRHLCSGELCAGRLVEARPNPKVKGKREKVKRSSSSDLYPLTFRLSPWSATGRPGMRDDKAGTSCCRSKVAAIREDRYAETVS